MSKTEERPPTRGPLSQSQARPRLAEGVELIGEYEGSGYREPRYIVRRSDDQMVQLTDLLYLVVEQCDGSKDLEQIAAAVSERYGKTVSPDNVKQLLDGPLRRDGIVAAADGSEPEVAKADPLLALRMRITLLPEKAVNFFAALLRPLFWPPVMIAVLAGLIALDVWYFGSHGIGQGIRDLIYRPWLALMLYGLLVLSIGWHELGHATACRYGGARPGRIGFGIYVVWPAFYTDVTDIYRLGKAGRVRTDLGGVYFNAIFALAISGLYFVTGFEPLLVLVLMQHILMLYQFMPFLRLDGYQVISDLTGVPDLFGRIGPVLKSLVPFKETPKEVSELKPWVRTVVSAWVLVTIPVLLFMFGSMVLSSPRILATAYDSALVQWDRARDAIGNDAFASATTSGLQMAMLFLPVTGMGVTFVRVLRRIGATGMRVTAGRPFLRSLVTVLGIGALGAAAWILWPNGEYRPIQPGEQWTLAEGVEAASQFSSGRPSLSEERAAELDDAPTVRENGGNVDLTPSDQVPVTDENDSTESEDPTTTEEESTEEETTEETAEPTPTETTVEEEESPTP